MSGPVGADFKPPVELALTRERLRAVIYGEPDVGKTTFAATFPRPLFIDTDHNLISIAVTGYKPIVFDPTGYRALEQLYFWMKQNRDRFDTIVWDSISTGQRLLLNEIHDQGIELDVAAGKPVKPVMRFTPEQGEHQAQQKQLERILTDLRRLGKHIVLTAGVRDDNGLRRPDLSPGNFSILRYWPSLMGELVVVTQDKDGVELPKPRRLLITSPAGRAVKAKFASLRPGVWDPNFTTIWSRVEAEYAKAEASQTKTADTKERTA